MMRRTKKARPRPEEQFDHRLLPLAWLTVDVLGILSCIGLVALALAWALSLLGYHVVPQSALIWLLAGNLALVVVVLASNKILSDAAAPRGSWTAH